jgi:hypothetical protein
MPIFVFKEIGDLWFRSLSLHTKQSHVHCEEATDKATVDFPLPNRENSVCWQSDKWKCASSVIRLTTSSDKIMIKRSATTLGFAMSQSVNSCTTTILYEYKFLSFCKILCTLWLDIPRAKECPLAERPKLLMNNCLIASMFCGDRTVCTQPGGFFL